jgi:DNA replication protein DnaC
MDTYERVHEYLRKLGLNTIEQSIDNYLENSKDRSTMEILDHLLEDEVKNLKSRRFETAFRYSGLPFRKGIEQFDFSFQPSIDRKTIDDLLTLRFIHNRENVVFLGPPGVGKTHLSVSIAMQAIYSGIMVYYVPAVKLVQILKKDFIDMKLNYRLSSYSRFHLMIVDEIGYLPLTREESNLFFQFVSSRYESRSTIYTSNKSFSEWGEVLGDQVMASAVLDRILHHCTVVNIRGESYRMKDRKKNSLPTFREVNKDE